MEPSEIKRLIRHRATSQFWRDGGWTEDPAEAVHFESISDAVQVFTRFKLDEAELVYVSAVTKTSVPMEQVAQFRWASNYRKN